VRVVDGLNRVLCWIKRKQVVKLRKGAVKVNVGCGLSLAPGWVNVDSSPNAFFSKYPGFVLNAVYSASGARQFYSREDYRCLLERNEFVHHDVTHGLPFCPDTVDYLYSSHFLEHLTKPAAVRFIQEARRVLKKRGVMRLCVPDLNYVVSLYAQGKKKDFLAYFFEDENRNAYAGHRFMYDYAMLESLILEAGFSKVNRCEAAHGRTPDLKILDKRVEDSLYLEAEK
jgi:predicted SAM-dependent methyltransferase